MNLLRHIVNARVLLTPAVNLRESIGHTAWSLQYSLVNAGSLWLKVSLAAAVLCLLWALYLARLQRLAREMEFRFEVQMAERMRIARELHDTLLQSLQGLILILSNLTAQMDAASEVREEMERALERAEELLVAGRNCIRDLRSDSVASKDFAATLHNLVDRFAGESRPKINTKIIGQRRALKPFVQVEMLWLISEALTNACRHSDGTEVQVIVSQTRFHLMCSIHAQETNHFELAGMRERSQQIGGRFKVRRAAGQGTMLTVSVPACIAYEGHGSLIARLCSRRKAIRRIAEG
jgi:signal transduction histidine kinase